MKLKYVTALINLVFVVGKLSVVLSTHILLFIYTNVYVCNVLSRGSDFKRTKKCKISWQISHTCVIATVIFHIFVYSFFLISPMTTISCMTKISYLIASLHQNLCYFSRGILISNFIFVDFDVNYNILVDFDVKIPLHRKMVSASNITLLTWINDLITTCFFYMNEIVQNHFNNHLLVEMVLRVDEFFIVVMICWCGWWWMLVGVEQYLAHYPQVCLLLMCTW